MGNFDLYHYAPGKRFQPDRGPANQVRAAPDNVVRTLPNAEVRELGFRRELERTPSRYSAISVAVSTNRACRGGVGFVSRPWAPGAILGVGGARACNVGQPLERFTPCAELWCDAPPWPSWAAVGPVFPQRWPPSRNPSAPLR